MTLRRDFLKAGGALVVGFHLRDALLAQEPPARGTVPGPPDPKQVDTWLAIHADNTATVYIGFAELGQGNSTALLQVAAEELDMDMSQLKTVRLDTNVTPNQGGTYSSASIQRGGPQVRTAAAEARQALLQIASQKLAAPGLGRALMPAGSAPHQIARAWALRWSRQNYSRTCSCQTFRPAPLDLEPISDARRQAALLLNWRFGFEPPPRAV